MRHALAVLMVCALLAQPVQASTKKTTAETSGTKARKPSRKAPKFIKSGEETTSERDRRLLRECKGRVNAGACAGYTG